MNTLQKRDIQVANSPAACRRLKGRSERKFGRLSAFREFCCVRTIVYIDGFNLYYRALRGTPHRWLDIAAMSRAALPSSCVVTRVNYYTARVSGRTKPDAPKQQHAYLRALATLPDVVVHYGNFLVNQKWAGLVQPPEFRPLSRFRLVLRRMLPMSGKPKKRVPMLISACILCVMPLKASSIGQLF